MVVIVIMGILAALIVPACWTGPTRPGRSPRARTSPASCRRSSSTGSTTAAIRPRPGPARAGRETEGAANWRGYLDKLPNDPWGHPYQYLSPGVKGDIDVFSFGADNKPGGEGGDADIGSWEL